MFLIKQLACRWGELIISKRNTKEEVDEEENDEQKLVFKSKLARNIHRLAFKQELPKYNELFLPRRMAYVIDLEDEETDIPVTLTRWFK